MNALKKMLDFRRKGLKCHEDFLQSFVRDKSMANDPSADSQILDNILTLIIAGISLVFSITSKSYTSTLQTFSSQNLNLTGILHINLIVIISEDKFQFASTNENFQF